MHSSNENKVLSRPSGEHLQPNGTPLSSSLTRSLAANIIGITSGVLGLVVTTLGAFDSPGLLQRQLFLSGALLMIVPAILNRNTYYIGLELLVIAGTLFAFLPIGSTWRLALALGVSAGFDFMTIVIRRRRDLRSLLGCAGFTLIAIGFSVQHAAIYLPGAAILSIYSLLCWRAGEKIALLWLCLNVLFCAASLKTLLS